MLKIASYLKELYVGMFKVKMKITTWSLSENPGRCLHVSVCDNMTQ